MLILQAWYPLYPSLLSLKSSIRPCLLSPHRKQILFWIPILHDRHWLPEVHLHMKECSVHSALQIAFPFACEVTCLLPVGITIAPQTRDRSSMFTVTVLELWTCSLKGKVTRCSPEVPLVTLSSPTVDLVGGVVLENRQRYLRVGFQGRSFASCHSHSDSTLQRHGCLFLSIHFPESNFQPTSLWGPK